MISNDEEAEISEWDCVTLIECREIVQYAHNWSEIFENIITRPQEKKISGGKEVKTVLPGGTNFKLQNEHEFTRAIDLL